MPNVRIAALISQVEYHLCVDRFERKPIGQWKPVMADDSSQPPKTEPPRKPLSPAAQRALAEAEARRAAAAEAKPEPTAKEFQGPKGPEPTRYGDWENKGIASDF
jgi:hypothetical protein